MSLPHMEFDPITLCRQINERSPTGGLIEGDRDNLHPDSNLPWRISPEPFWLSPEQFRYIEQLGDCLANSYFLEFIILHNNLRLGDGLFLST